MLNIKEDQLELLKEKEFSILLFHSNGCYHCQNAKVVFEQFTKEYPKIQFLAIELNDGKNYYEKYAEDIQEVKYVNELNEDGSNKLDEKGSPVFQAVAIFNKDGTPKMIKKYSVPSFYVHHTKAITNENDYGFVGGFDGNNPAEARAILEQINQILS